MARTALHSSRAALLSIALLWPWPSVAQDKDTPPATAELRIELQARNHPKPLTGKLWLPLEGNNLAQIEIPLAGRKSIAQHLPAGSRWELRAEVDGFWRPPSTVHLQGGGSVADYILPLWPSGWVTGRFELAQATQAKETKKAKTNWPTSFKARVSSSRTPATIPEAWTPCDLDTDGSFRCLLPATRLDLTLKVPHLIPKHKWGLTVARDKDKQLGAMTLRPGASLGVFVEVEGGEPIGEKCRARLRPLQAAGGRPTDDSRRIEGLTRELAVSGDGFVQFEGVEPGTYVLEAEQPGYAVARISPLEIWPESETLLERSLVLTRPFDLDLTIDPAADLFGEPWSIQLTRQEDHGGQSETVYQGEVGGDGRLVVPQQKAGFFAIRIADVLGNVLYADPQLEVRNAADAVRTLKLKLVSVEGRLLYREEPVAGILWFDGRNGANRVRMDANRDGEFEGYLSRDGLWRLAIDLATSPPILTELKTTLKADRADHVEVEIIVPDTEVFGQVVDEANNPVRHATVSLGALTGFAEQRSEEDGSFQFLGLPEGLAELKAEARSATGRITSLPVHLQLREGEPAGPLTLKLMSTRPITGRVISPLGPVPGATLRIETVPSGLGDGRSVRTGPEGRFDTNLSAQATAIEVVISAPGFGLQAFRQPLAGDELLLTLAKGKEGTLEILMPYSGEEARDRGEILAIWQDGVSIPTPVFFHWALSHGVTPLQGRTLTLPMMGAGSYIVCVAPPEVTVAQARSTTLIDHTSCARARLNPGETVQVQLGGE